MDRAAFKADLAAASAAFKPWGVTPQSYVWPKHQLRREWLSDLREEGFIAHRGPAHHRLYMPRPGRAGGVHVRAGRLVDAIVPISGDGAHAWPPADMSNHPLDVPESHFVRPLPRPLVATARSLQTVRLQDAMTHAAKLGRMLHLWWHPHNFGDDPKGHLRHLERLLQHFQALGQAWDFPSLTMLGAAEAAWDLEDVDHARASASSYTASYRPSTSVSP